MLWPSAAQHADKIGEQRERVAERIELDDLAADMHVDADDAHARKLRRAGIDGPRAADRNAEFVLRLAGRDLGMGLRIDVGIDADRNIHGAALGGGDGGEELELRLGFDIDAENVLVDGECQLARGLADAGEHDLVRRHAGGARAQQLALGDDVGAGAELCQRRDHRLVGIRLQRIADQRIDIGEGAGEHLVVALDGRARIAIERRADGVGNGVEIDRFGMEHAAAISEMVHGKSLEHDAKRGNRFSERAGGRAGYCSSGSRMNERF